MPMSKSDSWQETKHKLPVGTHIYGQVTRHQAFGFFVRLPDVTFEGLVQITDIKDEGRVTPSEFPAIGSVVEAVVLGFKELGRQVWLGVKPSQVRCANAPQEAIRFQSLAGCDSPKLASYQDSVLPPDTP